MKVVCVGWKLSREELETLKGTAGYIQSQVPSIDVVHVDAYRHKITDGDEYIAFGRNAAHELFDNPFMMPTVKDCKAKREKSLEQLTGIIKDLRQIIEDAPVKKIVHVETKENVTIGKEACDITLTDDEVQYLTMLKKMLDGSKMVITKGDLRIEVE